MNYILGFTIGACSIGWSAVTIDDSSKPIDILATGARIFPAGTEGDIETGLDLSRNKARQMARQRRTQLRRKKQRLREIRRVLIQIGLIAEHSDLARGPLLNTENPYTLRARALDERIDPMDLARIIYHMTHRRGFQSGRRTERENDEKMGVVLTGIKSLEEAILASGARTLGEHLSKLDPTVARRRRWTSRAMYRTEVAAIFQTQVRFHPTLTDPVQRELTQLLFFQRPLKSQAFRVGPCELEPKKRRMVLAHPIAQKFRLIQKVNDLRIVDDVGVDEIEVTATMRTQLIDHLMKNAHITFAGIRKLLKLPKSARFNFERAEEKSLIGHRTAAKLAVPDTMLVATAEAMLEISEDNGLTNRLTRLGHDAETIKRLLETKLEDGYLNLSRRAVVALLPAMSGGTSYMTAVKTLYPAAVRPTVAMRDKLPLVHDAYPHLANPLAARGLAELRKLVHAIIRKYGRPARIHLEFHRHLQTGPKTRQATAKRMRTRQREREAAAERLLKDLKITGATQWQIERVLLANEVDWVCPYTGKPVSIRALCGGAPTFHVMHILPFDMTLDDDFSNKTIAHASFLEKRHPELLLSEMGLSPDVETRYKSMKKDYRDEKFRRLKLTREEAIAEYGEKFPERFVESSSHLAQVAREYVSLLGVPVQVSRPRVTAYIREALGISYMFRDMRDDHRRHAFSAVAVALTTPTMIRRLCAAAKRGEKRRFANVEPPWADFAETVVRAVDAVLPSFRVKRRVRGPLHSENPLSKPYVAEDGKIYHLATRPLAAITESDIKKIAGTTIRDVVMKQFERLRLQDPKKYRDPKKAFGDPQNLPIHCGCQIRRVSVIRTEQAFPIGSNGHTRYVTNDENHHALILDDGKQWTRKIVSQFEAQRRLVAGEPVVSDGGLFTLSKGELFEMNEDGRRILMRCRSVNRDPRVSAVPLCDARTLKDIGEDLFRESVDQLRKRKMKKVHINLLGDVRRDGS